MLLKPLEVIHGTQWFRGA